MMAASTSLMSDLTHIPIIIAILVLFLLSAFFSMAEGALISLNKIRLRHMVEQKKRGAFAAFKLISQMDRMITTILFCNNIVNTTAAVLGTILFTHMFGERQGAIVSMAVVTVFLLVFCEITPKILATSHPERLALIVTPVINFFIFLFSPIVHVLSAIGNFLVRLGGMPASRRSILVTEEEIKMMIRLGKEEGYYGDEERRMLEKIFHFDEVEVHEVMTPLEEITSVPIDVSENDLMNTLLEEGHGRIPVYEGQKGNIIGIIYVHNLLYLISNRQLYRIPDLLQTPYFVPPDKKVSPLLKEFQKKKLQIAIVQNPDGGQAVGLVTLEDLIEEIVGEIEESGSAREEGS